MNKKKENMRFRFGIVSGYFNPLHVGHLKMIRDAKERCNELIVIVNNDLQQEMKKGKIIIPEDDRLEIIRSLKEVSFAELSIDEDNTVCKTLEALFRFSPINIKLLSRMIYSSGKSYDKNVAFFNGGDRKNELDIPEHEICNKFDCVMVFGVGGDKEDSSSRINKELGDE